MSIGVCAGPGGDRTLLTTAARLSVDLDLPFIETPDKGLVHDMLLVVTANRLELRVAQDKGLPVHANLARIDVTSPAGRRLKQPLARALGIKRRADLPIQVIDATAGFGEDTWLMAGLGCRVLAVERHPIVATLLRDGLLRAAVDQPDAASRIQLVTYDARQLLAQAIERPDVVYLDPMYPLGRKTAERKAMKVLRRVVGDDEDAGELFDAAMGAATRRVVVKRPARAAPLGDKPVHSHEGKGVRYDVYVP